MVNSPVLGGVGPLYLSAPSSTSVLCLLCMNIIKRDTALVKFKILCCRGQFH